MIDHTGRASAKPATEVDASVTSMPKGIIGSDNPDSPLCGDQIQATQHAHLKEEAREFPQSAMSAESSPTASLVDAIRNHIEPLGGVDLEIEPRELIR